MVYSIVMYHASGAALRQVAVLMGLTFPLPPKPEQIAMAKALTDARAKAANLREQARKARAQAWTDFEAAIYAVEDEAESTGFSG